MEVYKLICLIFSIIVFTSYGAYIWVKYGIRKSFSDSYYYTNNNALFAFFIWGFALPLFLVGGTTLMFLSCASICFVGASPAFKDEKTEAAVHYAGSYLGVFLSIASMSIDFGFFWLSGVMLLFILYAKLKKLGNQIWWIEAFVYYSTVLGLTLKHLL